MLYLVQMQLVMSGDRPQIEESIAFIEQIMLPSLQICSQIHSEGSVVAGGALTGAIAIAMIIEAESSQAVDKILMRLPFWSVMKTTVIPLIKFGERLTHLSDRVEQLRAILGTSA